MKMTILIWGMVVMLTSGYAADHKELKAYPQAKPGMERLVLVLPHKERGEDAGFKVELIPGKTMETDGVNRMGLGYSIQEKTVKGWGYTYYEVSGKGMAISTLIGVRPGTPKVKKFVRGKSHLTRYNSRLPVVVYVPEGVEIRYRIWKAGEEKTVDPG
jgi:ecotin